ncbi:anthranilate phosphoribosyltransferase [Lentisphaerota bacterium ZTH]|nr:anthranilate phosphoribosyltransferase [Lentisphaerota bacterium]WET05398.1 anthranilate phosphoribosyltransferase [Lentisphaerota bacterium ZTH]
MVKDIINKLLSGKSLSQQSMSEVLDNIMRGIITPVQTAALLTALRAKGETVEELAGAASTMRRHAEFIDAGAGTVVDTCGTGGDKLNTFNISTAAAFVVAGAGITVAKHGNRSVSSQCGSADVLAEMDFNLDVEPVVMEQCIQEHGIGFLFAPRMHPAMREVAGIRRELQIRTIFNMLGPLTNPAGATGQVIGVYAPELTELFAAVLQRLGTRRAFVVHGMDGLDEISCCAPTRVTELRDNSYTTYELQPDIVLGDVFQHQSITGGDAAFNARRILDVLEGRDHDGARAVVAINAAAAIVAGEKAEDLQNGLQLAYKSIDSGNALRKLEILIEASQT